MIPVELSLCPYRDIMPVIFFPCRDVMKNSTVIMSLQGKKYGLHNSVYYNVVIAPLDPLDEE